MVKVQAPTELQCIPLNTESEEADPEQPSEKIKRKHNDLGLKKQTKAVAQSKLILGGSTKG